MSNDWVRSYLSNREQFVSNDGINSPLKRIKCGVPQGSILGPLLFLVYINDLSKISNLLYIVMFADDTNVFFTGKNLKELETVMNRELALLYEWLCANKLSLNISKTHYMVFRPPRTILNYNICLKINNEEINSVEQTKFLGVILDSHFTWKAHINYIKSKLSKSTGILYKARRLLNQKSLLSLYYAFIYPYFLYCITIWGGANITTLTPLIKIQKRAIRIVCCKSRLTSTAPLFQSMKILNIHQIYNLQILVFMLKYKKSLFPTLFSTLFTKTTDIHCYATRQVNNYYPPRCKTETAKTSLRYAGTFLWNNLPPEIKTFNGTLSLFKKNIIKIWFSV